MSAGCSPECFRNPDAADGNIGICHPLGFIFRCPRVLTFSRLQIVGIWIWEDICWCSVFSRLPGLRDSHIPTFLASTVGFQGLAVWELCLNSFL